VAVRSGCAKGLQVLHICASVLLVHLSLSASCHYAPDTLLASALVPGYCFILFLPAIIQALGFEAAKAQAMSTPPFVLACTLTYFLSPLSDRLRTRGPLISFVSLLGVAGFSILYATTSPVVGYIGCFIACCGIYPNTALVISWAGSNTQGDLKRAVVLAIASGFGNVGGYGSPLSHL
jgi:hypothetical protein